MRAEGTTRLDPKTLPLRWLFLDLNSYFASVEQAENPELRNKPIAVCPAMGEGATIIAASYEAKAFGVKTGTKAGDAKRMCPGIILVDANHILYVHYHEEIIKAVDTVVPIDKVCSVDEMRIRLLGDECEKQGAIALAKHLKHVIAELVSPQMKCSIGIAPNPYLAKVGTEMQKPDGLVVIEAKDLPDKLYELKLRDFPGINYKTEARLQGIGIFTTEDLLKASVVQLSNAVGKVMSERWWHLLRGYDIDFEAQSNKSLGHSNVLAPEMRNDKGVREIMKRLTYKACTRLRAAGLWAEHVYFYVADKENRWQLAINVPPTQDAITVLQKLEPNWVDKRFSKPIQCGLTFTKLKTAESVTPSLFEDTRDRAKLGYAMDHLNGKFGKNTVYAAALKRSKDHASEKIAFQKVSLLSEGKDDNIWKKDEDKDKGGS